MPTLLGPSRVYFDKKRDLHCSAVSSGLVTVRQNMPTLNQLELTEKKLKCIEKKRKKQTADNENVDISSTRVDIARG